MRGRRITVTGGGAASLAVPIILGLMSGTARAQTDAGTGAPDPFFEPDQPAPVAAPVNPRGTALVNPPGNPPGNGSPQAATIPPPAPPTTMKNFFQSATPYRHAGRSEFLERNYIFYNAPAVGPSQNKPLIFEAQVAPHLFFYNGLQKVEYPSREDQWLQSVSLTFAIRIRMVGDTSTPVRPPSYMPRLNYQNFFFWKMPPDASNHRRLRILEWRGSLGHHSNGQQYCRFDDTRRIPTSAADQACPPVDVNQMPDRANINFRSGDFATNYLLVGGHFGWLTLDAAGDEVQRLFFGISGETNARWLDFLPGSIDAEQYRMYGPQRLRGEIEYGGHVEPQDLPDGTWRTEASAAIFSHTAPGVANYRVQVEASYVPDGWGGLGFFARFFAGQDYMNILYLEPAVKTVQFGLIWDLSPRVSYNFKPGGT